MIHRTMWEGVGALIASSSSPHTVKWVSAPDQIDNDRLLPWAEANCVFVLDHMAEQAADVILISE